MKLRIGLSRQATKLENIVTLWKIIFVSVSLVGNKTYNKNLRKYSAKTSVAQHSVSHSGPQTGQKGYCSLIITPLEPILRGILVVIDSHHEQYSLTDLPPAISPILS